MLRGSRLELHGDFWRGFSRCFPLWIGVIPFGIAYSLAAHTAGLSAVQTMAMSLLVFAGASQMTALGLFAGGFGAVPIITSTLVVNLRHILMSASLAPHTKPSGRLKRLAAAFGVTDESYAMTVREVTGREAGMDMLIGANANMYLCWQLSTAAGLLLGEAVPAQATSGLALVFPLSFTVLLLPYLRSRSTWVVAALSGCLALGARVLLPAGWYLPSIFAGGVGGGADVEVWLAIGGMALVTYATRVSPFFTLQGIANPLVKRVLEYVPPVIFAGLIVPSLLAPNGTLAVGAPLYAGLIGAVVAWRTKNVLPTIVVGLGLYALMCWVGVP